MIFPYFKFAQLAIRPNWYDNLDGAMDEEARVASMRTSAGWEAGEGGWSSPDGIHETDWADEGWPFPEDAPGFRKDVTPLIHPSGGLRT